ncbi:hypothetical protein B296_00049819 [Ensete ventricosum]|uniref:DUF668 domain-containing protein n=1 Tax=Ensete ventricosum TaxID=4639 RepID=A0A426X8J4_ENSVE|nr:hypothetical protein B296_00049819 [Ensete ventricosum]
MKQVKSKTWLGRVWLTRGSRRRKDGAAGTTKPATVGVLAFEVGRHMSKVVQLWHALSDDPVSRLREEVLRLEGVRKLVSDNEWFLLALALAEMTVVLGSLAGSVACLAWRCSDPVLRRFDAAFANLVQNGDDPFGFEYAGRKMERKVKKMEKFVATGATLYQELELQAELQQGLRQMLAKPDACRRPQDSVTCFRNKVAKQREQMKHLRETSLWVRTYDYVVRLLARSLFSIIGRIRLVFEFRKSNMTPLLLNRDAEASPEANPKGSNSTVNMNLSSSMIDTTSQPQSAPASTLGAAALALHYANVIVLIEKLATSTHLMDADARDHLYSMLTTSIKAALRARLGHYGKNLVSPALNPALAAEWTAAVRGMLERLAPLAHNMIRWHYEKSFEQQSSVPSSGVLLLQTLYFADQKKAEDAITELLVGLNYLWRYRLIS